MKRKLPLKTIKDLFFTFDVIFPCQTLSTHHQCYQATYLFRTRQFGGDVKSRVLYVHTAGMYIRLSISPQQYKCLQTLWKELFYTSIMHIMVFPLQSIVSQPSKKKKERKKQFVLQLLKELIKKTSIKTRRCLCVGDF